MLGDAITGRAYRTAVNGQASSVHLRWLGPGDENEVERATFLFDHAVESAWVRRFLAQPNHHLCIAYLNGQPSGFVSGVEMTHPDKGTEMFLYELGVDDARRGQGIGKALVQALVDRARNLGCYGMWVLTSRDNDAALATYRSSHPDEETDEALLGWHFG